MEICFHDWLNVAYSGKAPEDDTGNPMREAQRFANTEYVADEESGIVAMTLLLAIEALFTGCLVGEFPETEFPV
jgi:hypothetical protein